MWNKKEVHWLHTGYNMWPWPWTSLMTFTYLKWQGSELIWFWTDCMTLAFDHIHDLDLGVSRSESEIALSQKWGGRLTWNEKDVCCGSSIHDHESMILTSVTMVGMVPSTYLVIFTDCTGTVQSVRHWRKWHFRFNVWSVPLNITQSLMSFCSYHKPFLSGFLLSSIISFSRLFLELIPIGIQFK